MNNNNHPFFSRNVIENVIHTFDLLTSATSVTSVLEHHRQLAKLLHFNQDYGLKNFIKLKNALNVKSITKWSRVSSILKTLDQKTNQKEYQCRNKVQGRRILVIGGGISGLRVSIELLLLGAKVICVEKRDEFSRNNVIHLWPNVINDMYTFEAKRLYGQFCVGSIDHISIRQLQLLLLKIALIYGLDFYPNVAFDEICPRIIEPKEYKCNAQMCNCCCHTHGFGGGAYAHFKSSNASLVCQLNRECFDVIIGCDGRRNTFSRYFPRNNRRGKLAIGLTANFVNRRTEEEAHCPEISGISRIYNQKWFKDLQDETDIELENLVYYRDETHYFVMTATKMSLLKRGVLKSDYGDSHQLLHLNNIDTAKLMKYSKDAAEWSSKLKRLEFALNSSNMPDVALFDFTSMYSATNASCAKKIYLKCCDSQIESDQSGYRYTLMLLCGDSLLEPFWPTGSGAGRGFLSALDAAWTVSQWFTNLKNETTDIESMLNVISRREYIYRLLAQTSPENTTNKNFTLDPHTRYKNLNLRDSKALQDIKLQVRNLIIDKSDLDIKNYLTSYESKRARRATVGIDPQDILKAKAFSQMPLGDFDDLSTILPAFSNKLYYPVPSTQNALSNCDNLPIEVVQLKPRNFDPLNISDYKPRNADLSDNTKRNYQARNHFFCKKTQELDVDKNCNESMQNLSANSRLKENFLSQSTTQLHNHHHYNKENCYLPDFKELFYLNNDSDNNNQGSDLDLSSNKQSDYNRRYINNRDHIKKWAEPVSKLDNGDLNSTWKPKKSSDILEKAQSLEQKFDEFKKPFLPKLNRVGKIEEEDWNVKIWNSNDIFAPKVKDRKNLVHDNSKELLQSRIKQLNNNISSSSKEHFSPKPRVTNEYVHLLSNEVSQKFSNHTSASHGPISNSSPLLEQVDKSTVIKQPKQSDLLRPLGECKRCNKTITAIDRVTVRGLHFHKNCLTCKACSIMLRQDEIEDDEFVCKVCLKSRTNLTCTDSRSAFFNNNCANSIEAKKNFLVNVEQIDLRERAEFELVDSEQPIESSNEEEEVVVTDDVPVELTDHSDQASPQSSVLYKPLTAHSSQEHSSSEISESDANYSSDTNYTDDEHSDSDDHSNKTRPSECNHSSKSLECINPNNTVTAGNSSEQDLSPLAAPDDSCTTPLLQASLEDSDDSRCEPPVALPVEEQCCSEPPTGISSDSFFPMHHSYNATYPASDSSLLLLDPPFSNDDAFVVRAFGGANGPGKTQSHPKAVITKPLLSSMNSTQVGHKSTAPYRYSGHFTEKFYRTLSQPTLSEQMNLIDRKLKKSSALQPLSQEELPFADSMEDISSKDLKLCQAPFASIDDI